MTAASVAGGATTVIVQDVINKKNEEAKPVRQSIDCHDNNFG